MSRTVLVCRSPLTWEAGVEPLLQALRVLHDRGRPLHLHLTGRGPERERVLFTAHDLGLGQHVHLRRPPPWCRRVAWAAAPGDDPSRLADAVA